MDRCKEASHASNEGFHPDRVARRDSHYRYPRRDPLSRLRPGSREGAIGELPIESEAIGHRDYDVCPGLRWSLGTCLQLPCRLRKHCPGALLVVRPDPTVRQEL